MKPLLVLDRRAVIQGTLALGATAQLLQADTAAADSIANSKNTVENGPAVPSIPFMSLPPQPPINMVADIYAATALNLSRMAVLATRCKLDIPYGEDPVQKVDVYLPRQANLKNLPVFVNIHGGGWVFGYKEWMGLNAPSIVQFPAIYVAIGYRLGPKHRHPTQLEDCLAALAWVHKNIAAFGGNPERIFIGGHSAGAHLAALVTLRTDLYERFGLPAKPVQACFPYNGVYDFRDVTDYGDVGSNNPGEPFISGMQAAKDASPILFVKGNPTPFFITWAENDITLIKAESAAFVEALKDQPGRVEKHMFPHFDHFWTHLDQQRPASPWTLTLRSWMTGNPATAGIGPFEADQAK